MRGEQRLANCFCKWESNDRVFMQSWRWDHPFSERFSERQILKPQFWYPPLRFGCQHRIPKPTCCLVSGYPPLVLVLTCKAEDGGCPQWVSITEERATDQTNAFDAWAAGGGHVRRALNAHQQMCTTGMPFPGKVQKCNFFADHIRKRENSLGTNIEHTQSACIRKRAEYCFESTVSKKRTHWASLSSGANSVSPAKNSVSSFWHTNNRLRGTHWARSPELSEPRKTHRVRCLKPYSPKPYSGRFRCMAGGDQKPSFRARLLMHVRCPGPLTSAAAQHINLIFPRKHDLGCDPSRHLQECPGARPPERAPKSFFEWFWAPGSPPKSVFLAILGPSSEHSLGHSEPSLKKHSLGHFPAADLGIPQSLSKQTPVWDQEDKALHGVAQLFHRAEEQCCTETSLRTCRYLYIWLTVPPHKVRYLPGYFPGSCISRVS